MNLLKKWPAIAILLLFSNGALSQGKRIYLTKGADNGILMGKGSLAVQPGDTLVMKAADNPFSYVYLGGFEGAAGKPIVLINEGGQVVLNKGFDFEHAQYIKLTGSGTTEKYGFLIQNSTGVAVAIHGKSAHIEAERFFAQNCAFGCWIKNEANCDTTINNWVLDDISVHDYKMQNIGIEGFYMGSTDPNNVSRPINCNGVQQYYKPSKLGNIKVYNGFIDGTGRPAIMLCNAQIGMSEIYNNVISNVGREYNDQQGTGISLGSYTRAYVHHNTIRNTYTWGIASLGGSGLIRIEHNKVDSSGNLDGRKISWAQNIMLDTRTTIPVDSTRFLIKNNAVTNPGSSAENIRVYKTLPTYTTTGNEICNNLAGKKPAKVVVEPGIEWKDCKSAAANPRNATGIPVWMFFGGGGVVLLIWWLLREHVSWGRKPVLIR